MLLTSGRLSRWSFRIVLFCGSLAFAGVAYTQSYYGSNFQPSKVKPFASQAGAGHGQASYMHPTRDLYNKYFYHNPSVSPYLNLDRPTIGGTTAYHTWVRPEQQRRERQAQQQSAYIASRKQQTGYTGMSYGATGKIGRGAPPRAKPNAYYNQWYGSQRYR